MADRNTPASFTFEDFRVEFNELATDVGDINDLPTDIRSVTVSDLVEAVNEIVTFVNVQPSFTANTIVFEGATDDDYETTLAVTDPTDDRTITFPDATGNVIVDTATQTLTNKVFSGSSELLIGDGSTSLTVSTSTTLTRLSSSASSESATLADVSNVGQIKIIILDTDGGGNVTITPTTFSNGNTITMQDATDSISLIWTGANGWTVFANNGCTIA